ncbi:MAG: chalcone isomerase family protein [Nitrospiraceae bacterium]|nr:MAG: chalcone isomerase family protein [Nitrospiraceae bacterium]
MRKVILYIMIPMILLWNSGELSGAEINGVYFEDMITEGNEVLRLRGAGLLKWLFFKVYVAALYVPEDVSNGNVLEDKPKKMVFHYLTDMTSEQFAESGEKLLEKNASQDELFQIKGKLEKIHNMYRDVKKGGRYSLTYFPDKGTELALNDEVLGVIEGYDFASIYYRIWLGENPVSENLKYALLNKGEKWEGEGMEY